MKSLHILFLAFVLITINLGKPAYPAQAAKKKIKAKSKLKKIVTDIRKRGQWVEDIFKGRTVDGNLGMAVHKNFWLNEEQADGTIKRPGDAAPESRSLNSNEYLNLVRNTMGIGFAMTTVSDRSSNRTTGNLNDNLERLRGFARRYDNEPNTVLIRNSLEIDPTFHQGKLGVLLYSQKHYLIKGRAVNIREHQKTGLRIFQLSYTTTTPGTLNGSADERLAAGGYDNLNADPYSGNYGLTTLGENVVRQLVNNYMVIDVSHTHGDSIIETAALTRRLSARLRRPIPIIANHVGAIGVHNSPRNLSDDAIDAIASTGGVIGVMPLRRFIGTSADNRMLDNTVAQINYIVDRVGVDHVGLGSDSYVNGYPHNAPVKLERTNGTTEETGTRRTSMFTLGTDLNQPNRWKQVVRRLASIRLRNRGGNKYKYSIKDLKKIAGGNFIRVLRTILPGYSKPVILNIQRRVRNRTAEYYFNWKSVRVNKPPNGALNPPQYKIIIQAKKGNRYRKVFTSSKRNSSFIAIKAKTIDAAKRSEFRGYIRAINPDDSNQYVHSDWFYFDKMPSVKSIR